MATIKVFNTGRLYTVAGQRIAWTVLSNGKVAMVDLDRMIQYVLTVDVQGGAFDRAYLAIVGGDAEAARVMHAYDRHDGTMPWGEDYALFQEVSAELYEAARNGPVVKRG